MTKLYLITIIPFSDERFLWECTIFICTGVVGFTGRYFFGVDLGGGYIFSGVANANSATPGARIRASWKELNGCFLWTIHYSNEAVLHFQINHTRHFSSSPNFPGRLFHLARFFCQPARFFSARSFQLTRFFLMWIFPIIIFPS